jgi:hypothetical protein
VQYADHERDESNLLYTSKIFLMLYHMLMFL